MFFRQFLLFIIFFQFSNAIFAQDDIESDILFQKIQELEIEIANLRNELESLNYLIQKLIDESSREVGNDESNDIEKIKLARKTIVASQQDLNTKIELLDNRIEELNENPQLPIVQVASVNPSQFDHYIQVQGSVKSDQLINIYPEFSGIIKNIYVKSGDKVKKGDPLVKIDDGGLKEQLSQLEIKFELTKTTFERQKKSTRIFSSKVSGVFGNRTRKTCE